LNYYLYCRQSGLGHAKLLSSAGKGFPIAASLLITNWPPALMKY
jgi:hypothetical protein